MSAQPSYLPHLPSKLIDATLSRLGGWESSVERPSWTVPGQQLRLPPQPPAQFTVHHDRPEQLVRFQSCQEERQFWIETLPNIEPRQRRVDRFRQCGAYSWVSQDEETGQFFMRGESCKLRVCPVCRRNLQRRSADRVLDFMQTKQGQSWQFQTLTLKHSAAPLPEQLARLVACFRRLRQRKLWKSTVRFGYAVIEVTYHAADSLAPNGRIREQSEWHPHLHVLAAVDFIDWSRLRSAWLSVTGDSDAIDCQLVKSAHHAARYVAKYVGKPPDLDLQREPARALEYYRALQHRRLLMPFGDTSRHKPPPRPPARPSVQVCQFSALLTAANAGNYPAQCMLTYIILGTVPRPIGPTSQQGELFNRGPP